MSEIKPTQYFKPDDFDGAICYSNYANEKLAPVLKMLTEMAEGLRARNYHDTDCIDALESFNSNESCECGNSSIGQILDSYKSFLAQIEKEK